MKAARFGLVALAGIWLAACGGTVPAFTPVAATQSPPTQPPEATAAPTSEPVTAALTPLPPTAALAGLPSAPAPVEGGFRADSAALVGATGRPQFIEFFTYW